MKYLELLTRIRMVEQRSRKARQELTKTYNREGIRGGEVAKKKKEYMRLEGERGVLIGQAGEMIRNSSDAELMYALFERRVCQTPWENISRKRPGSRSEMELRLGAYEYIKQNYDHPEVYSDCF